jgi:F0F1-type ATP synthase membrane subunit b/b'
LFGFLFWKLKPKLVSGFQEWSNKIHKQYDGAEAKSKEAHLKLEVINKRYDDIENEKKKIMAEAEQQAAEFASVTLKEAKERTQKIAEETLLRSEAEKSKMLRELNAGILEKVIARTKSKIKTDSIVKSKTVKNLLQRIH